MSEIEAQNLVSRVRSEVTQATTTVERDDKDFVVKVAVPTTARTQWGETYEYQQQWQLWDLADWDWLKPRVVAAAG